MLTLKKILKISFIFIILLSINNKDCFGKKTIEKNSTAKGKNTSIDGKLNVTGSVTFNDIAYAKNGLQISKGELSATNGPSAKKHFSVDAKNLNYSGNTASFGQYSFDLAKNQSANKPYYSGQTSSVIKKTVSNPIRSTNLQIFPISFVELLNDTTYTALHGAYFNIKAIIGGTIDSSPVEALYIGNIYILPASSSEGSLSLITINETTTSLIGDSITFNASVVGTGTSATLYLQSSSTITNPEISYYYEVVSNNIGSIG